MIIMQLLEVWPLLWNLVQALLFCRLLRGLIWNLQQNFSLSIPAILGAAVLEERF